MFENQGYCYTGLDVEASKRKVAALIEASGLSDKEIGDYLRLSIPAINKWRNAHGLPDLENLLLLSRLFGLRLEDLIVPVIDTSRSGYSGPQPDYQAISRCCRYSAYYAGISLFINHPLNDSVA